MPGVSGGTSQNRPHDNRILSVEAISFDNDSKGRMWLTFETKSGERFFCLPEQAAMMLVNEQNA